MEVILDEDEYNRIWTKIDKVYQFKPSVDPKAGEWIRLDPPYRAYRLTRFWDEKQEGIVRQIMRRVIREEMYALVWNSDCFIFHPDEMITPGLQYRDFERGVNVYFPSYYPDGDYYFFVSTDWANGLYGHPWRKEIRVKGEKMIRAFEEQKEALALEEIGLIHNS